MEITSLEKNKIYKRTLLQDHFGGQRQGGISTPAGRNYILIFSGDMGEQYGYRDGWDEDGIFNYTGEGQVGDMEFIRGNKAILEHQENGKEILLFSYVSTGMVKFVDFMILTGHHFGTTPDRNGNDRQAIVFELTPRNNFESIGSNQNITSTMGALSLDELRKKAIEDSGSSSANSPKKRKSNSYNRSEAVKEYVLKRANGVCESCDKPAPFITAAGKPYLEPHHIKRISDGGPDHPEWVIAICPNCHKEAHYSGDAEKIKVQHREKVLRIEKNLSN